MAEEKYLQDLKQYMCDMIEGSYATDPEGKPAVVDNAGSIAKLAESISKCVDAENKIEQTKLECKAKEAEVKVKKIEVMDNHDLKARELDIKEKEIETNKEISMAEAEARIASAKLEGGAGLIGGVINAIVNTIIHVDDKLSNRKVVDEILHVENYEDRIVGNSRAWNFTRK